MITFFCTIHVLERRCVRDKLQKCTREGPTKGQVAQRAGKTQCLA